MPRRRVSAQQAPTVQTTITMPAQQDGKSEQEKPERPDFWTYMQRLTPEQWNDHIVYVTREEPKTSINGLGGYLFKTVTPFDIDEIKMAYGGRVFSYIMKKKGELIYSGKFPIEAPPKFDPTRENTGAPAGSSSANSSEAQTFAKELITVLREELSHAREGNQGPNAANDATVDMLVKASEKAMTMMEKRTPEAGNPATMFKDFTDAMKNMGFTGGQQHGSTLGALIAELTPLATLLMPLLTKFMTPTDPIAQITQYKTLLDMVDGFRGKGGSSRTTTEDLILKGIETLPDVIRTFQMEKQPGQPGQQVRRPSPAIVPAPGTPPGSPQRAPQGAAPLSPAPASAAPFRVTPIHEGGAPAEQIPQPETESGPEAAVGDVNTAADFHLAWVKRNIVEMMAMGQDAQNIAVFLDMQKPDFAADISNYDLKSILGMIAMDPILSQLTQIQFYELKIEAIRKALIEMDAEDEEIDEETLTPVKVN